MRGVWGWVLSEVFRGVLRGALRGFWGVALGFALAVLPAQAWSPFASNKEGPLEVTLSAAERAKLAVNAGWAKGDTHTLLFEIRNGLDGPVQCNSAQVELMDGKKVGKVFLPKVFVPAAAARNASIPGIEKGQMRQYAVDCTCFKVEGRGRCVNPLRSNGNS